MTRLVKLPQIQNVGTGASATRATLQLTLGRTYNKIMLFCAGNITRAKLSQITLKLNNGEKQRWKTSEHLQAKNAYLANAADADILEINFVEQNAKDEAAMTLGTYALTNEAGVQSAVLEFDIATYTPSADSVIEAYAEVDVPSSNRLIARTRHQQKTLSGAVEEQVIVPFGQNGEQIKRLHIFGDLTKIDYVRVRRDDSDEFEEVTVIKNEFYQKTWGKVPQTGLFVVDFVVGNLQGHMLNTGMIMGPGGKPQPVQNLDIKIKTNDAVTLDIYTESLTLNDRP